MPVQVSGRCIVGKDGIAFKGARCNFAVAKSKAHSLDGVLVLERSLADPRIRTAQIYKKKLFGNQLRLTQPCDGLYGGANCTGKF